MGQLRGRLRCVQRQPGGCGKDKGGKRMTGKRVDYITWDEYFMGVALLSGRRSKDQVQVGACIVSQDNKILSMGL